MSYNPQVAGATSSENNTTTADVAGSAATITSTLAAGATEIAVSSVVQFPSSGTIRIGDEYITYGSITDSSLNVTTRGAFNTDDVEHSSGATIVGVYIGTSTRTNHPDVMVSLKSDQAGTEYFDFSNDNTNWDTFPVTGFGVAANIHEFHTAVKGFRYFRIRFENASATKCSSFRVYTSFGVFRQGNLPLNQSIGPDSDSLVVQAISTGQLPDDTFRQTRADGAAFTTTSVLAGTTLATTLTSGETSSIELTDSTSFPASGTIQIATVSGGSTSNRELITYSANDLSNNILTISARGSTPLEHTTASSVVGEVFDSSTVSLVGYTQVKTHVLSSHNGDAHFRFFSDASANDQVRALTVPYTASGGYQLYSAPCFGEYAQYLFANTSGVDQTDLYFSTWCLTKALSGQVLSLNAFIAPTMVANLGRNVLVGKQPDDDYVNLPADGNAFQYENATMAADASYASGWWDSDGYNSVELFISSDQLSAVNGIQVDFTNDVQESPSPTVRASLPFAFTQYDIDEGFKRLNLATMLDGFRVTFTNGSTQANVFMSATLKTNGTTQNFDKSGATQVTDFTTSVALGGVSNFKTRNIEGRNNTIAAATDLIGVSGTYAGFPTSSTPVTLYAHSSDVNDNTADTGARTVQITGLASNTSTEYTTQAVTMNGSTTNAAQISGTWWRVISARVLTAGSTGSNEGTITISTAANGTGTIYARIRPNEIASTNAVYTVPANHKLIIKHIVMAQARANGASGSGETSILTRASNGGAGGDAVFYPIKRFDIQTGMELNILYEGGIIVDEGTDIKVRCEDISGTSAIFCDMEFILIQK